MRIITPEFNLIKIGYQGENEAVCVQIGVQNWPELYGAGGTFSLRHQRAGDPDGYPVIVTEEDGTVSWVVSNIDTRDPGYGKATLIYKVNDVIAMSVEYSTLTEASVGENPEPPDPWKPWIDEILEARDEAVEAAEDAHEDANSASQSADDASTEALKAEGYAVGTQDGEAVGPDSPYYENNAKYYHDDIMGELGPVLTHLTDYNNPHQVTKAQVGLGNVDNTSDLDKPISTATQAALDGKISKVAGAVANDIAVLTADGSVADSGVSMTLEEELEGQLISFKALAATPLKALSVALSPIQNLNGYDNPWPAGGGKNKVDYNAVFANDYVDSNAYFYIYAITLKANTTYVFSTNTGQASPLVAFFLVGLSTTLNTADNGFIVGQPRSLTTDGSGVVYIARRYNGDGVIPKSSFDNGTYYLQAEEGSTATSYLPYSNICPISGRTETTVYRTGATLQMSDYLDTTKGAIDGKYLLSGGTQYSSSSYMITEYIPVSGDTCKIESVGANNPSYGFYDSTKTWISGGAYLERSLIIATIPPTAAYIRLSYRKNISASQTVSFGNAYTIDLNGTVYGGTLNVKTGVLTVDRAIFDMGSINWGRGNNGGNWAHYLCYAAIADIKPNTNALCEAYPMIITANVNNIPNKTGAVHATATYVYFRDDDIQTAADFKTAMNGIHLVYELATPITVALTPTEVTTLLGDNNVWSDGDSVTLTRYKGLAEIIAEIVGELNA